jgi:hypothetical protein
MAGGEVAKPASAGQALPSPWPWLLTGLAASGLAFLTARLAGADADPVRFLLLGVGLVGATAAVCLRFWGGRPAVEDLPVERQAGVAMALGVATGLMALAATGLLILKLTGAGGLPWATGDVVWFWLVAAPWSGFLAIAFVRQLQARAFSERLAGAGLLAVAALVAFLACWALYVPGRPGDWDSMRLLLAAVALAAFIASAVAAATPRLRRILLSVLIVYHFGAIATAVLSYPPSPWLSQLAKNRLYQPYLDFMQLGNAYRFYSPEPFPSTQLWFRVEYREGRPALGAGAAGLLGAPLGDGPFLAAAAVVAGRMDEERTDVFSHWFKLPDVDEEGRPRDPLRVQYQRRLSLTENVTPSQPLPPRYYRDRDGVLHASPYMVKRDRQCPEPILKENQKGLLGQVESKDPVFVPYLWQVVPPNDPRLGYTEYAAPDANSRLLLQSYARHAMRLPHPTLPNVRAVSVKIYKVLHHTLRPEEVAAGVDPQDLANFVPYYEGQYSKEGLLLDPEDPFLYWMLPIVRENRNDPNGPVHAWIYLHAGDEKHYRDLLKQRP